ncbi:MAG: 4-(cytidine 5'-diphospho)-2-C-methyl-D-erythritol kinase [Gammaproteobacteria bacterium]|nr:4-(cytidine 5'-diphospho)-2-C-methyl-D-erythritol kinase [Gammaproteobacteria bacterium]
MPINSDFTKTFSAPAKINLFLHVLGQRPNGYHEIETVFQFLELEDQLTFEITDAPSIIRQSNHDYCKPEDDLIIRAANSLKRYADKKRKTSNNKGAKISVSKCIPPGSGLGGGSSNAATTLIALNHLWEIGLSRKQLIEIGTQLGADVPVFLYGQSCWATGVGERLTSHTPAENWYCIAIPNVHVSTQEIFSHPALIRNHPTLGLPSALDCSLIDTVNDLQAITALLYPKVQETLDILNQYGSARMSGSGSSVFVSCGSHDKAKEIVGQLPNHITGFATRSLNRHPLINY